jgi:hypothetical protein
MQELARPGHTPLPANQCELHCDTMPFGANVLPGGSSVEFNGGRTRQLVHGERESFIGGYRWQRSGLEGVANTQRRFTR